MNSWDLKGKRALVSGGTKGIGKAIVIELLQLGAEVLLSARKVDEVDAFQNELRQAGYPAHGKAADVTIGRDREELVDWIGDHWGSLDILVNNAGINIRKRSVEYSQEDYMKVLETDLLGAFEFCRMSFSLLQKGNGASVINISSVAGTFDLYTGAPYGMAKAGLIQLSRSLAVEWAQHRIRVNTVSPWFTDTPMVKGVMNDPKRFDAITSSTPLRRFAEPSEVAAAVAFLAMDKASYITGHNLVVDGGASSRLW